MHQQSITGVTGTAEPRALATLPSNLLVDMENSSIGQQTLNYGAVELTISSDHDSASLSQDSLHPSTLRLHVVAAENLGDAPEELKLEWAHGA